MRTRVIDLHGISPERFDRLQVVYVGRAMRRHKIPAIKAGSPLGNPFRADTPGGSLERYRQHLLSRPDLLALLPALRGRVLGCWCCSDHAEPGPLAEQVCHAQVIAELADGPLGDPR